jgi:uncharacterized protein (TIGR02145 family)
MLKKLVLAVVAVVGVLLMFGCAALFKEYDDFILNRQDEPNNCGTDGTVNSCKTVVVGGQTWMAENLNREMGASWWYKDTVWLGNRFGRLYDWETARNVCPDGWHLPSREEWNKLIAFVGRGASEPGEVAGGKLKSTLDWASWNDNNGKLHNNNGTDDFGFTGRPGGHRLSSNGAYGAVGHQGAWWTATEESKDFAYNWQMTYVDGSVTERINLKTYGISVRCIQN